jgi:hypothetical protein
LYVDRKKHDVCKELTEKSNETQMGLQAIRMYIDKQESNLMETIADTKEHLLEDIQGEAQIKI